jgi:hypothetical protein
MADTLGREISWLTFLQNGPLTDRFANLPVSQARAPHSRNLVPEFTFPSGRFADRKLFSNRNAPATISLRSVIVIAKQETQATILAWADETFGPVSDPLRSATRVHEELLQLSKAIQLGKSDGEVRAEAADVAICLYRVAASLGSDLDRRVGSAMNMGMARELVPAGDSPARAVLRAETKLMIAKNMIADNVPRTRVSQELTAVRVILEEMVARLGGSLTVDVDAKMSINRERVWRLDASGHGYHDHAKDTKAYSLGRFIDDLQDDEGTNDGRNDE